LWLTNNTKWLIWYAFYPCSLVLTLCTSLGSIIRTEINAKLIKLLKLCGVAPRYLALQPRFGCVMSYSFANKITLIFLFIFCIFYRFFPTPFLFITVHRKAFILKSMMTLFPYRYLDFTTKTWKLQILCCILSTLLTLCYNWWLQDDPLLFDYNVEQRVQDFVAAAIAQVGSFTTVSFAITQ